MLRASNQAELVATERSRYNDDLKAESNKVKTLKGSLKLSKAKMGELEKERDEAWRR